MLFIEFNPIDIIMDVCNKMFPDLPKLKIDFIPSEEMNEIVQLEKEKNKELVEDENELSNEQEMVYAGFTMFSEDGRKPLFIYVNGGVPIEHTVEIIAHEVAHVIAGVDADHGEKFQTVFDEIYQKYCEAHSAKMNKVNKENII